MTVARSSAAGVGWGAIHAVVMVGTALSKHMGPGAAFSESCSAVPSVVVSGEWLHMYVFSGQTFPCFAEACASIHVQLYRVPAELLMVHMGKLIQSSFAFLFSFVLPPSLPSTSCACRDTHPGRGGGGG